MIHKKYIITLFILIIVFFSINQKLNFIPSLRFQSIEQLENYGSKQRKFLGGPLPYISFIDYLKEPEEIKNRNVRKKFLNMVKHTKENKPFTSKIFNNNKMKKYYSDGEMETDFKYFNNSANLQLFHYYNS